MADETKLNDTPILETPDVTPAPEPGDELPTESALEPTEEPASAGVDTGSDKPLDVPADPTPAEPTTAGDDGSTAASVPVADSDELTAPTWLEDEDTKPDEAPVELEGKPEEAPPEDAEPATPGDNTGDLESEPKAPTFGDVRGEVVDLSDHLPGDTLSSLREAGCELFLFLADLSEVDTTLLSQETGARLANVRNKTQLLLAAIESVFIRHG